MTEQKHFLATTLRRPFLATGLKITICLIAILAIGYTQTLVESWGGGYGGSLRDPLITQIEDRFSDGFWGFWPNRSDMIGSDTGSIPYPFYPWNTEHGEVLILALALLVGLYLWHTLWAAPRRRERLLAEELRPMSRLVNQHPARKAAHSKPHKRHPSGAPAWH